MGIGWQLARGGEYVEQRRPEETIKSNTHELDLQISLEMLPSSKNKALGFQSSTCSDVAEMDTCTTEPAC